MSATGDAAVANHVDPVAYSVDDLSELVKWAPRSIELTAAVIGYHDPSRADVDSAAAAVILGRFFRGEAHESP